jgi:hypothetical protein
MAHGLGVDGATASPCNGVSPQPTHAVHTCLDFERHLAVQNAAFIME